MNNKGIAVNKTLLNLTIISFLLSPGALLASDLSGDDEPMDLQTPTTGHTVAQSDAQQASWAHLEEAGWNVDHEAQVVSLKPGTDTSGLNEKQANKLLSPLRDFSPFARAIKDSNTGLVKELVLLTMQFCHGDVVDNYNSESNCNQYGVNGYRVDFGDHFLNGYKGSYITFAAI